MSKTANQHRGPQAADVKAAARCRWVDILSVVAGIDTPLLDGRNHPCPKCGGRDRFRMVDVADGAVFCNQCFNRANGDGLAAVAWMLSIEFDPAVRAVARYIGHDSNGHVNGKLQSEQVNTAKSSATPGTSGIADAETLDRAYGLLLNHDFQRLIASDRIKLRNRGLNDTEIDARQYRSFSGNDSLASEFQKLLGSDFAKVPGFGFAGEKPRMHGPSGLAVPVRKPRRLDRGD